MASRYTRERAVAEKRCGRRYSDEAVCRKWWASLSDKQLTALLDTKPPGVLGQWDGTPTLLGRTCRRDHRGHAVVEVWYDDRSRATPWRWHFEFESGQANTSEAAQKEADRALRKKGWRLRNRSLG